MRHQEAVTSYIAAFVDQLAQAGVNNAVVCPGSRSTPLAMLLSEHPDVRVWMHVDERSAGFFALGRAKASGKPVALLCSSGTAAANFFPAVVEAAYARVPLVVLTADRPHELRDVGAPQAIDQNRLYGHYPKWFVDMALPEATDTMLEYARMAAMRAAATAVSQPAGPVHLNFPLREPLVPEISGGLWEHVRERLVGQAGKAVYEGAPVPAAEQLDALAQAVLAAKRGLIVCGPATEPLPADLLTELAEMLGFPILADPLSQLRTGPHANDWIIDSYDAILREPQAVAALAPDFVIRFGAMPVSKAFLLYLKQYPHCRQLLVDPGKGWRDPTLFAADMVVADPARFCADLMRHIKAACSAELSRKPRTWGQLWQEMDKAARAALSAFADAEPEGETLFEGRVFLELARLMPADAVLFAGNSMPIRDLDAFFGKSRRPHTFLANRGANGIDGVVSTALGAATVKQPLVLVLGDLSFYHDLNGLLAAKLHGLRATIIVINNNGGGIFSFLPQAEHPEHFEQLFGTPLGLEYRYAVDMYGGRFVRIGSWEAFRREVERGITGDGLTVIEVPADRADNLARHRGIWSKVAACLRDRFSGEFSACD
ncbi:MAG TPA: 2-succinyl-5-enolpyruvyl-6-hydroxy-3-cyclohexene-1-carboxylic-acid synthase [Bacilli bacterium]